MGAFFVGKKSKAGLIQAAEPHKALALRKEQEMQTPNTPPKEWANPTPAGLAALAVACVCFFALLTGRVGTDALPLIGCWLLGGFVVQLIVGLCDLKSGSVAGGNAFIFFCAFFMLVGGLEMIMKYLAIRAGTPLDIRIDGYVWAALAAVLILWTPAFCKQFSLLSVIIVLIDAALPFIALVDLGLIPARLTHVSAWLLLGAALVAIYHCGAMVVNAVYGRAVYPLPGAAKSSKKTTAK